MKTLVVIPTYNERESLPITIKAIRKYNTVDILVVDDGSPDGTGEWVKQSPDYGSTLFLLQRTEKNGLGPAYIAGLLAQVERGADLAIGSRWIPGGAVVNWPRNRHFLSRGANVYVNVALGLGVHDATAGFRAFKREVLETIDLSQVESAGYCFQIDMTMRVALAGFSIVEVPITFVERELGESKMDGNIIKEAFTRVAEWGVARRTSQVKALVSRLSAKSPE